MELANILIVGAGPAGLAIAGRLSNQGIQDYTILEASERVGNSWHNHYDRLHLHTVKQWSHLPHMPFPDEYPLYVKRDQVAEYLNNYADHFTIKPQFGCTVNKILKSDGRWLVETNQGDYEAKHVVVASGINKTPHIPGWPGQDEFKGSIIHSIEYKNPRPYKDKKVLIIGMGNTGAELAFDLSQHGVETYLSVRGEISLVPRDLNGQPVQVTAKRLDKLPFGIGDWIGSQIRKIYFGNMDKYGLKISKVHPVVQLRETGKTPVIDIGTVDAIKKGKIKVLPNVRVFNARTVVFEDGRTVEIDDVILATGYRAELKKVIPQIDPFLNDHNLPKGVIGDGDFSNMYFIGFDNYSVGGILGTILDESKSITDKLN